MTFAGSAQVHKSLPAWRRLARAGGAVVAAAVLLSACGGGDQVKKFKPTKIVSFGDEGSALVSEEVSLSGGGTATVHGLKYGVNTLSAYANIPSASIGLPSPEQEAKFATSGDTILGNSAQTKWAVYPLPANYTAPPTVTAVENLFGSDLVVVQYQGLLTQVVNGTTPGQEAVDINLRYLYSCVDNALWIQIVARNYGLGYNAQCPMDSRTGATTYAEHGATVAATAAQVAARRGELNGDTLVTLMAGQNDVLEVYAQLKAGTLSLDAAKSELTTRGSALAAITNDIVKTGARVLLVRLPDMGLSPLANTDNRVDDLKELTLAFNKGILNKVTNDGHKIALFNFYDYTRYMYDAVRNGNSYNSINNISTPLCSTTGRKPDGTSVAASGAGLLYCNEETLGSGVSTSTYFWADQTRMGPAAHAFLGTYSYELADDNPL